MSSVLTGAEAGAGDTAGEPVPWPDPRLEGAELLIDDPDLRVLAGFSGVFHQHVIVSLRDFGGEGGADFYDEEAARVAKVRAASAARVLESRIIEDRFVAVTVLRPHGELLLTRLTLGVLEPEDAVLVGAAALEVMAALHELGLSASGMRLRSAARTSGLDGRERFVISTFGLAVDNDVDPFIEHREVALRVLALMGGRYEDRALRVPETVPEALIRVLRRSFGLDGVPFETPGDLATAMFEAIGKRPRVSPRSRTSTRPHRPRYGALGPPQYTQSAVVTSDLLLASDYLATLPTGAPIELEGTAAGRRGRTEGV